MQHTLKNDTFQLVVYEPIGQLLDTIIEFTIVIEKVLMGCSLASNGSMLGYCLVH